MNVDCDFSSFWDKKSSLEAFGQFQRTIYELVIAKYEKLDLYKFAHGKYGAKKVQTTIKWRAKMVTTPFAPNLQPDVNWIANTVFTIFALISS